MQEESREFLPSNFLCFVYGADVSGMEDDVFPEAQVSKPEEEEEDGKFFEPCQFSGKRSTSTRNGDCAEAGSEEEAPKCVVCEDRATGYHYAVFTCEGCKGFFKRTVQKQLEYTCRGDGDCEINQYSRNRCQYCRYMKCVAMGMLKEAVREDRTPGGRHRHKSLQDFRVKKQKTCKDDGSGKPMDMDYPMEDEDSSEDCMEIIGKLCDNITVIPAGEVNGDKSDVNVVMQYGYQELHSVIQWAKVVPGFRDLCVEDQVALLKSGFMDLNVFRLAFRSVACDPNSVLFAKDIICDRNMCLEMGWTADLVDTTLEFTEKLRSLNLDQCEFACLSSLVLLSPDTPDLRNKDLVSEMQTKISKCLSDYEDKFHPQKANRYGKLLLCLSTLRSDSEKALESYITLELFGKLDIPPLVAELLD